MKRISLPFGEPLTPEEIAYLNKRAGMDGSPFVKSAQRKTEQRTREIIRAQEEEAKKNK